MSEVRTSHRLLEVVYGSIAAVDDDRVTIQLDGTSSSTLSVRAHDVGHSTSTPVWIGARVAIVTITHPSAASVQTLAVLEPDYVVDVTELAEAWSPSHSSPERILLQRLRSRSPALARSRGSLLNSVFDLAVTRPEASDEALIDAAMATQALSWAVFAHQKLDVQSTIDEIRPIVNSMRERIKDWSTATPTSAIQVEPHVISPVLGIAGRFDILIQHDDDHTLLEMKGGKAPKSGVRINHAAQVCCYALLYLTVEHRWPKHVGVWYVSEDVDAIRPLPADEIIETAAQVLRFRNAVVAMEHALAHRNVAPIMAIGPRLPGLTNLDREAALTFHERLHGSDPTIRAACLGWLCMLHRERWVVRLGAEGVRGQHARADLWRDDVQAKRSDPLCITDVTVDAEASDLERMHLWCTTSHTIAHTSLRAGDMVVLHAQDPSSPFGRYLLKGTLDFIEGQRVSVTLRNKFLHADDLVQQTWIMEADLTDRSMMDAMPGAVALLMMATTRQQLLIGKRPPLAPCQQSEPLQLPGTTEQQRDVIERALYQPELFLIQGPPGTGKTTIALRSIVHHLVHRDNERVLVLAYTNRAVSEICDALQGVVPTEHFLRHGSKAGVADTEHVPAIPHLAQQMSAHDLADRIAHARVVVATVSSVLSSSDLFAFGDFSTAVIDEASQLLEPAVMAITRLVSRLILIGDHAQLPPVITQPLEDLRVNARLLHDVHLHHLGMTTFERLFVQYVAQGWQGAFGILRDQGRMHVDVMAVPSTLFYQGALAPVQAWQRDEHPLPWHDLLPHRAAFLPVLAEPSDQQQAAEVQAIVRLVTLMMEYERANDGTLRRRYGIMTPFRAQNYAVMTSLPEDIRAMVTVDTVERFQGSQRDVVIYGTAVASTTDLRSITSEAIVHGRVVDRKFNVASTRAREQFILIGHPDVLCESTAYASALDLLPRLKPLLP